MYRFGYRVEEFAKGAGISRSKVYGLLKSGDLKAIKVGRITLIPEQEAEEFFARLAPYQPQHAA